MLMLIFFPRRSYKTELLNITVLNVPLNPVNSYYTWRGGRSRLNGGFNKIWKQIWVDLRHLVYFIVCNKELNPQKKSQVFQASIEVKK